MKKYPKIQSLKILPDKQLEVCFENGTRKIYDCTPILNEEPFNKLQDNTLFKQAHVDLYGYGVAWNDQIDLSESELWENGKLITA